MCTVWVDLEIPQAMIGFCFKTDEVNWLFHRGALGKYQSKLKWMETSLWAHFSRVEPGYLVCLCLSLYSAFLSSSSLLRQPHILSSLSPPSSDHQLPVSSRRYVISCLPIRTCWHKFLNHQSVQDTNMADVSDSSPSALLSIRLLWSDWKRGFHQYSDALYSGTNTLAQNASNTAIGVVTARCVLTTAPAPPPRLLLLLLPLSPP